MTKAHRWILAPMAACLLLCGCQPGKTGFFSSIRVDEGRALGIKIFITRGDRGAPGYFNYFAQVQCADGAFGRPVLLEISMADVGTAFSMPPILDSRSRCPRGEFVGRVEFDQITGRFAGGREITIPRGDSLWQ